MVGILSARSPAFRVYNLPEQEFHYRRKQGIVCEVSRCGFTVRTECGNDCLVLKGSSCLSRSWIGCGRQRGRHERAGRLEAVSTLIEGDVVEYVDTEMEGRQKKLGVVVSISSNGSSTVCEIEPLCQEVPGSNEWVEDEDQPQVCLPVSQVQVVEAWFSQRMVPDRVSNPHGEHAHNIWLIENSSLTTE